MILSAGRAHVIALSTAVGGVNTGSLPSRALLLEADKLTHDGMCATFTKLCSYQRVRTIGRYTIWKVVITNLTALLRSWEYLWQRERRDKREHGGQSFDKLKTMKDSAALCWLSRSLSNRSLW